MKTAPPSTRNYVFTPALHRKLRLAYALTKMDRARALTELQRGTGWPRHAFIYEAQRLGISATKRRWSKAEDLLILKAGAGGLNSLAAQLRRTTIAIKARAGQLQSDLAARRDQADYSVADLARILGAPRFKIEEWVEKGLFGAVIETEESIRVDGRKLATFIRNRNNVSLIDFRVADQAFLKAVLCG